MDCPVIWKFQLEHEIAFSSMESEYTGLSCALCETIPILNLLNKMATLGFIHSCHPHNVICKVFKDNSGALQMAFVHKYSPQTKHLNIKLHHFHRCINEGKINIVTIKSTNQQADYLTKPVKIYLFTQLPKLVMGW